MATNITDLAFDDGETLTAAFANSVLGETTIQVDSIDFQAAGVLVTWSNSPNVFTVFVPYWNIKSISQVT